MFVFMMPYILPVAFYGIHRQHILLPSLVIKVCCKYCLNINKGIKRTVFKKDKRRRIKKRKQSTCT